MIASLLQHTNSDTMQTIQKKVGKRKLNAVPEVAVKNKVNRLDIKLKKSATKAELILHIDSLEKKFDELEKDLVGKNNQIKTLEENISKLKKDNLTETKETQTESGNDFKCIECNFEGSSKEELKWHMHKNHGWPDNLNLDEMDISLLSTDPRNCERCDYEAEDMYDLDGHTWDVHDDNIPCDLCDNTFYTKRDLRKHIIEEHTKDNEKGLTNSLPCKFCKQVFNSKGVLMEHSKREHSERVSVCWNYASGDCVYGSEKCWFDHCNTEKYEIKCNLCDQIFTSQSTFLTHRKQHHGQLVAQCRNYTKGTCNYAREICWFQHNENENNENYENNENNENSESNENNEKEMEENREMIQKIFKMMENFTNEIVQLKEMNNLQ